MLSTKHAKLAIQILSLCLIAAISFFFVTNHLPDTNFIKSSLESVEESNSTIMKFSAATLSTSLAISALPDDFATPLAESFIDLNTFFIGILAILFFEKILILYGIKFAFVLVIPLSCGIGILSILLKKHLLKSFAVRLCILGFAAAFVVPCSTHITNFVAADLIVYVENTIHETENGTDKLNDAMDGSTEDKTIFENLSDLFQTAIHNVSDLLLHFQNTIRRCMNSIAILILTNCLMPLLTFFFLKWLLKETFNIVLPVSPIQRSHRESSTSDSSDSKCVSAGE